MEHLSPETLSEYLDGGVAAGAEEHLSSCPLCLGELEALRELRGQLRTLPDLEAPPALWSAIEARLPVGRRFRWFRTGSPAWVAMQTAAAAAVFALGLGLGRVTTPGDSVTETSASPQLVISQPTATTLTGAMEDVRLRREEYDAALRQLETIARQTGGPLPPVAEERLAALDVLVEASRAALAAEPADPVLNSYLFAATEQRADVLREIRNPRTDSDVLWR